MKRVTDKLIALQFLAVVLPIAVVLIAQLVIDARRAEILEYSRPFRILAAEARANYQIFTNGVTDAATSGGMLGTRSVEALQQGEAQLNALAVLGDSESVSEAAQVIGALASAVSMDTSLKAVIALRQTIARGDALTATVNDDYERRDELVVRNAIASAVSQRQQVIGALILSAILSALFVRHARRRLKTRMDAEIQAERRRRTELEAMSLRFSMATRAARAGVYELKENDLDLWWSDSMYALYAQSQAEFKPALASWLDLIHPADRQSAKNAITAALCEQTQLRSRYRVLRADRSERHIESLAAVVTDAVDGSSRLVGIDLDITEQVEADERERKLQRQLRESSRLAGMAEIATSVLHNIGNVLNSVNISATMVTDRIRAPKAAGLGKIAVLVQEHAADLADFIANDARGKHLPTYLTQLSEQLGVDQRATLNELELLRKNIDHIKEVVVMQQTYSKLVGTPEKLTVQSLVDDAMRMNAGGFTRHGVRVQCDFEEVPEIVVEKHKVVQILINLLHNAKYACDASLKADKLVVISIERLPEGVRIGVTDNGIGIQPEHMTRIFNHGFTTKKDGHGFGLHSGALAAKELGGELRVASAGLGHGASFTLDLPLRSPEAACA